MSELVYKGLGFPVRLKNVKTREFRGEVLPDINHRKLEDLVFRSLLWLPARFSGAHLIFIRGYMKLSQKDFALALGMKSHATISAWESKASKATTMPLASELVVRMLMADLLNDREFAIHFKEFLRLKATPSELKLKVA